MPDQINPQGHFITTRQDNTHKIKGTHPGEKWQFCTNCDVSTQFMKIYINDPNYKIVEEAYTLYRKILTGHVAVFRTRKESRRLIKKILR